MTLGDLYKEYYFIELYQTKQRLTTFYYSNSGLECKTDKHYEAKLFNSLLEARLVAKRVKKEWGCFAAYIKVFYILNSVHRQTVEKVRD